MFKTHVVALITALAGALALALSASPGTAAEGDLVVAFVGLMFLVCGCFIAVIADLESRKDS